MGSVLLQLISDIEPRIDVVAIIPYLRAPELPRPCRAEALLAAPNLARRKGAFVEKF